jgi:hypothetical protein
MDLDFGGMMNKNRSEHWIPVKTSSGMFSSEYAISLQLVSGEAVSFFVDKELVRENVSGHFLLKVVLVDEYPNERKQRVLLPTETFETASRWVEVAATGNNYGLE